MVKLTSKEIMARTGISRATLNNYIALGILPRPMVAAPNGLHESARRIGYFEEEAVDRIQKVQQLKNDGLRMSEIASRLASATGRNGWSARQQQSDPGPDFSGSGRGTDPTTLNGGPDRRRPDHINTIPGNSENNASAVNNGAAMAAVVGAPLHLTLADIDYPAYMVNNNFELLWWNAEAERQFFGDDVRMDDDIQSRSLFRLLFSGPLGHYLENDSELLRFHVGIAKKKLSWPAISEIAHNLNATAARRLSETYETVAVAPAHHIQQTTIDMTASNAAAGAGDVHHMVPGMGAPGIGRPETGRDPLRGDPGQSGHDTGNRLVGRIDLFASFFREGILFAYAPGAEASDALMSFLASRERVIRELLQNRQPFLTHLAVLSAQLHGQEKLRAEMPPEQYFELINDIWGKAELLFRAHHGSFGSHPGDGLSAYFLPEPDGHYALNALRCGIALRETLREVERSWRGRCPWLPALRFEIGIDEGHEWFGCFRAPGRIELKALGDNENQAYLLSSISNGETMMASKQLLSVLPAEDLAQVRYGVSRVDYDQNNYFIPGLYVRLSNFVDLDEESKAALRPMGHMPITEISDVTDKLNSAGVDDSTSANTNRTNRGHSKHGKLHHGTVD